MIDSQGKVVVVNHKVEVVHDTKEVRNVSPESDVPELQHLLSMEEDTDAEATVVAPQDEIFITRVKNLQQKWQTISKGKGEQQGIEVDLGPIEEAIVDLLKNWMIFNLLLELLTDKKLMLGQCQDLGVLNVFTSSDLIVFLLQVDLMKIDHGMLHRDCFLAILNKLLGFDNLFAGKL